MCEKMNGREAHQQHENILNSKRSRSDQVNINLQKTISNLISNVISSLCQQFIRYEHSIDIFGVLSINIDEDVEISVKVNEKFTKKEPMNNFSNFDCSKIIETIKKNVGEKQNVSEENFYTKGDTDEINREETLNVEQNENDCFKAKRRPRKPQLTFRHIIDDMDQHKGDARLNMEVNDNEHILNSNSFDMFRNHHLSVDNQPSESPKTQDNVQDITSKDSKTDFQSKPDFRLESNDNMVDHESAFKANEMAQCQQEHNHQDQNHAINQDSFIDEKEFEDGNPLLKCPICDRQFKRKFFLARHKRAHQNVKAYNCNMCGMSFDLTNQLKRHLRNMHMNNRDNLRRSCAKYQKVEDNLNQTEGLTSSNSNISVLNNLIISSTCPSSTTSTNSQQILPKSNAFVPYSYPPGLIASQSGKKQISNTFTSPSSMSNHYQVRQLFNTMVPCSEATFPYNNSMYFVQNYPTILPAISQSLYSQTMINSKVSAGTHNSAFSISNSQRLPTYRSGSNIVTSPCLKSIPLANYNSFTSTSSNELTTMEKATVQKSEIS